MHRSKTNHTKTDELLARFDVTIERCIRTLTRGIGMNVLDPAYKPSLSVIILVLVCVTLILFCLYTISFAELETKIETITYLAVGLQSPIKLDAAFNGRFAYRKLLACCQNAYRVVFRTNDSTLSQKAKEFFAIFNFVIYAQCIIVILVCMLLMTFPLMCYAFGIQYQKILPLEMPGLDVSSGHGYWVNTVYSAIIVTTAMCGILPSDAGFLILVLHAYLMFLIIRHEVNHLNHQLRSLDSQETGHRMSECVTRFRAIMQLHSDYFL